MWSEHLTRVPPHRHPGETFRGMSYQEESTEQTLTCWRDYTSCLVWELVSLNELEVLWASLQRLPLIFRAK